MRNKRYIEIHPSISTHACCPDIDCNNDYESSQSNIPRVIIFSSSLDVAFRVELQKRQRSIALSSLAEEVRCSPSDDDDYHFVRMNESLLNISIITSILVVLMSDDTSDLDGNDHYNDEEVKDDKGRHQKKNWFFFQKNSERGGGGSRRIQNFLIRKN